MAKGALAAGLGAQGGGRGSRGSGMTGLAQIGLSMGAAAERKNIREQEAQKEFTEKREAFKKEQQELYDGIAYEDQFEDTGITDLDEAGQKFADTLRSEYEMNNQMYEMGYIDEAQLRKRNARMKGQVKHLKEGLYGKMTAFKESFDKLQAEGKESEADSLKMQMMEEMTKNISFGVDGNGNVEIRTPGTGDVAIGPDGKVDLEKATRIPLSKFNDLMTNENGVDLNSLTDRITDLEGAGDIYRAGSREYTRYTGFGEGRERQLTDQQSALMDTAIAGLSQTEKIDALSRLGGVFTDESEYNKLSEEDKKDALFIDPKNVMGYGVEMEQQINEKLKLGLNNKLMNELVAKESSKPYEDSVAKAARLKAVNKEPVTKSAQEIRRYGDRDEDRLVTAHYPTSASGIEMDYIVNADQNADVTRQMFRDLEAQVGSQIGVDAISNVKYQGDMVDAETGYTEVEFGMDVRVPVYQKDQNGQFKLNDDGNKIQQIDPDTDEPLFETKSEVFKYRPMNLSDYNKIITRTGRNPISNKDWQKILDARMKAKANKGKYADYSPNKD